MPEALFQPAEGGWLPTELARGPWSPDALHGGPVAALVVREAERQACDGPMLVTRATVELLRPVPLVPLAVAVRLPNPGRRVDRVEVTLSAGGREIVRAVTVRVRVGDLSLPSDLPAGTGWTGDGPDRPAGPQGAQPQTNDAGWTAFHNTGMEIRYAAGGWRVPGPATAWLRLRVPVVPGEEPSGAQRAAAAADFGNGLSGVLPFEDYTYVNPELTVHLVRQPEGEWVQVDAATHLSGAGIGLAESLLSDVAGPVGRAAQALVVAER